MASGGPLGKGSAGSFWEQMHALTVLQQVNGERRMRKLLMTIWLTTPAMPAMAVDYDWSGNHVIRRAETSSTTPTSRIVSAKVSALASSMASALWPHWPPDDKSSTWLTFPAPI
jgi:hypothetical protein